ncbi:Uncharacterized protein PECH_002164 [Penicillium ucsense]|uniref:HNH nuclease domain-containing protein n=1 Tax=Penicillium ucsense TaxID=2839758 RepID=A0A8J8W0I2_9EURO|nr:Uncharacterized protein PECM_001684 [Penicillium ucsense]KAF7731168.1 Uncharacterized protein PECH_002164 [Penicillium ucsense]
MSSSSKTKLDQKLQSYIPLNPTDNTKMFLRDFFKTLPPEGKGNLVEDVSGCADDEKLRQLVQSIRTGLLIPMKAQGGKTPTEITPSPRPGVEDSIEDLKSQDIDSITRSVQSQLRSHCLERDGNKCLASGYYSYLHPYPQNAKTARLEAAHIIPFALGSFDIKSGEAVDRHAKIWVNLRRYFPALRRISFTSEQINSEKNVMMLDALIHAEFGQFNLIFEATGIAHQYRIKTFPGIPTRSIEGLPRNRLVKFRVHKGSWELPHPKLLEIHASIGNFLHMSGQAEIIDQVLRDFEDCGGLAPCGSTNIEDLLAVSKLSLLPSNVDERSPKSTDKPRPTEEQGRLQAKCPDTENKPGGY